MDERKAGNSKKESGIRSSATTMAGSFAQLPLLSPKSRFPGSGRCWFPEPCRAVEAAKRKSAKRAIHPSCQKSALSSVLPAERKDSSAQKNDTTRKTPHPPHTDTRTLSHETRSVRSFSSHIRPLAEEQKGFAIFLDMAFSIADRLSVCSGRYPCSLLHLQLRVQAEEELVAMCYTVRQRKR